MRVRAEENSRVCGRRCTSKPLGRSPGLPTGPSFCSALPQPIPYAATWMMLLNVKPHHSVMTPLTLGTKPKAVP